MSSESENLEEISESENNSDEEVAQKEQEEAMAKQKAEEEEAAKQKAEEEEAARVAAEEEAAKQKAEEEEAKQKADEDALTVAKQVENIEIKIRDVNDIIEEPEKNVTIQLPSPPPVIPAASQVRAIRRGSRRRPGIGMINLRK